MAGEAPNLSPSFLTSGLLGIEGSPAGGPGPLPRPPGGLRLPPSSPRQRESLRTSPKLLRSSRCCFWVNSLSSLVRSNAFAFASELPMLNCSSRRRVVVRSRRDSSRSACPHPVDGSHGEHVPLGAQGRRARLVLSGKAAGLGLKGAQRRDPRVQGICQLPLPRAEKSALQLLHLSLEFLLLFAHYL